MVVVARSLARGTQAKAWVLKHHCGVEEGVVVSLVACRHRRKSRLRAQSKLWVDIG